MYYKASKLLSNRSVIEMAEDNGKNVISSTDLTKWRLKNERGRQTWWYDVNGDFGRDSNFVELHSLGLDTVR